MKISIPKETIHNETRVAATPQSVKELIKAGYEDNIETGSGTSSFISDDNFKKAGANIVYSAKELFKDSDIIIKVAAPTSDEIELMPEDSILVSFFEHTIELEKVQSISNKKITSFKIYNEIKKNFENYLNNKI